MLDSGYEFLVDENKTYEAIIPESSEWSAELIDGVIWTPNKGKEPNWFHRFMQRLCFGIKWTKAN